MISGEVGKAKEGEHVFDSVREWVGENSRAMSGGETGS